MEESYPPVRIVFGEDGVLVEDGPARGARAADQRERCPTWRPDGGAAVGGVPNPMNARGRAAIRDVRLAPGAHPGPHRAMRGFWKS